MICDNARFHMVAGSRLVRQYLAEHGERIMLHYLPVNSPRDNRIELVWWHLHEQITRNHRCADIEELVKLTMACLDEHGALKIEGAMYGPLVAEHPDRRRRNSGGADLDISPIQRGPPVTFSKAATRLEPLDLH